MPIARRRRSTGRSVIAAHGLYPGLPRRVLLPQYCCRNTEVPIGIEQMAGMLHTMPVIAEIDLSQAGVDTGRGYGAKCVL